MERFQFPVHETPQPESLDRHSHIRNASTPNRPSYKTRAKSSDPHATPNPDLNFSRKRGHKPQDSVESLNQADSGNTLETHTPKRVRSDNWPLVDDDGTPVQDDSAWEHVTPKSSVHKRHASNPSRSSKFKEESMRDRLSDKPPSMFLRVMKSDNTKVPSVDHLMEDYMATASGSATVRVPGRGADRDTQMKGFTHHPNVSISSAVPSESSRSSGLFRFGRSIASAFNPLNMFSKKTVKRGDIKEETEEDEHARQMAEQKAKAETAYAELKKNGQLYSLGARQVHRNVAPSPSVDSTPMASNPPSNRDSGIDMDEFGSPTGSNSTSRTNFTIVPAPSLEMPKIRKGSFHIRTPSLSNLKKKASEVQLNGRRTPSLSLEAELPDMERGLRRSQSRKDIRKEYAKAQKLTKRVSDLEGKLEAARRELNTTLKHVPPVPSLPATLLDSSKSVGSWRTTSPSKSGFVVGGTLPSLASERTLRLSQVIDPIESTEKDETMTSISPVQQARVETLTKWELNVGQEPADPATSPAAPSSDALASLDFPNPPTRPAPQAPSSLVKLDPSSQLDSPPTRGTPEGDVDVSPTKKPAPKKTTPKKSASIKKRKAVDRGFRPAGASTDDDAEWEAAEAASKIAKRKRNSATTAAGSPHKANPKSCKKEKAEATTPPESTASAKLQELFTDPQASPPKMGTFCHEASQDDLNAPRSCISLETVHEETVVITTTSVALSDVPNKPTALSTPANPKAHERHRGRSMSPVKISPGKKSAVKLSRPQPHVANMITTTGTNSPSRRGRSPPPPQLDEYTKAFGGKENAIVKVKPDGMVPDLPDGGHGVGVEDEGFDWERDTF